MTASPLERQDRLTPGGVHRRRRSSTRAAAAAPLRPRRGPHARRAFTLAEAIASIVVLAILGTAVSTLLSSAVHGSSEAGLRSTMHAELSVALDRIARELRGISLDPDAEGVAPDIDSITSSSLTFNGGDSLALSAGTLTLTLDGSAGTLLTDVTALSIQPYNESNSAIGPTLSGSSCDPIRRIAVTITVTRFGVSETLSAKVFLRATMVGAKEGSG